MRRIAKALAVVPLGVALAVGLYLARNPERAGLGDAERAGAPGRLVRVRDGVTHYERRTPAAPVDTVLALARPSVVALYAVPPDSVLTADDGLQSLLDDFMYYWADSRPRLEQLGVDPLDQPVDWRARMVRLRVDGREWRFTLKPDSAGHRGAVGYLLAAPGREPRLLHGVIVDEELADSARAYLGRAGGGR